MRIFMSRVLITRCFRFIISTFLFDDNVVCLKLYHQTLNLKIIIWKLPLQLRVSDRCCEENLFVLKNCWSTGHNAAFSTWVRVILNIPWKKFKSASAVLFEKILFHIVEKWRTYLGCGMGMIIITRIMIIITRITPGHYSRGTGAHVRISYK